MTALKHPEAGTVVHVSGEQEASMKAAGWVPVEEPNPKRSKKSE